MRRNCEFCNRFWRWVATFALPLLSIIMAGFVAGCLIAFQWASTR